MGMKQYDREFKIRLGYTKRAQYGERRLVFLTGFSWDCGWYWGGGCIGNKDFHAHFDGAFLETPDIRGHSLGDFITPWQQKGPHSVVVSNGCSVWEPIETFLDDVPEHISKNWWRIKDLYKQFYALRAAAEVFHSGGHCTSKGRTPGEIDPEKEKLINEHIATVIIPAICDVLQVKEG